MASKGQIVGIDWNRIARVHSHVLTHMNSLTASRCHINASHMNSLTASRRHIKAYQDEHIELFEKEKILRSFLNFQVTIDYITQTSGSLS